MAQPQLSHPLQKDELECKSTKRQFETLRAEMDSLLTGAFSSVTAQELKTSIDENNQELFLVRMDRCGRLNALYYGDGTTKLYDQSNYYYITIQETIDFLHFYIIENNPILKEMNTQNSIDVTTKLNDLTYRQLRKSGIQISAPGFTPSKRVYEISQEVLVETLSTIIRKIMKQYPDRRSPLQRRSLRSFIGIIFRNTSPTKFLLTYFDKTVYTYEDIQFTAESVLGPVYHVRDLKTKKCDMEVNAKQQLHKLVESYKSLYNFKVVPMTINEFVTEINQGETPENKHSFIAIKANEHQQFNDVFSLENNQTIRGFNYRLVKLGGGEGFLSDCIYQILLTFNRRMYDEIKSQKITKVQVIEDIERLLQTLGIVSVSNPNSGILYEMTYKDFMKLIEKVIVDFVHIPRYFAPECPLNCKVEQFIFNFLFEFMIQTMTLRTDTSLTLFDFSLAKPLLQNVRIVEYDC